MAIHHFRYSLWDGTQDVPDFTADDLLHKMTDDLLRGGDPERALRDLMRRGFRLPDGRRFQGMNRLLQQMREYRQEMARRYDPNNMVDKVREALEEILRMEREEIDRRHERPPDQPAAEPQHPGSARGQEGTQQGQTSSAGESERPSDQPGESRPRPDGEQAAEQPGGRPGEVRPGAEGAPPDPGSGAPGQSSSGSSAPSREFEEMLERMLQRKEAYLQQLPEDNAGRIGALREYDFLSQEAREAFEQLVGGMQRELMEHYFEGLKQGIGQLTPQDMDDIRQMVRDLNQMLEAAQAGDREAFDRFMDQYRDFFPQEIESLEDLLEHLQRQASAMQSLLDSMDPEQRAQLQAMMDELLRDDRLRLDLARLGSNLAAMGYAPRGGEFPFRGDQAPGLGESLDMMRRLQAMQDLENGMRRGDPFNAMAGAGTYDPQGLFGPGIGGQIEAVKDMAESLLEAGYLQRDGDKLSLTARAIRKLGDAALREIFQKLKEDRAGGHTTPRKGAGGDVTEDSRPYQFGDPFHVDIKGTVMNGVFRAGTGIPVQLEPDDFAVFQTERAVQHATVLALDMSYSMYLSDLFVEAKKTALALDSLIRGQFPRDALYLIGFANVAFELTQEQLPGLSENDYVQGTNYEMALGLARRLLGKHRGGNRQILFVTDGEPTACCLPNGQVYFHWPPPPFVQDAALLEAGRCAKEGITINTFALDSAPDLIAFLQELTAVNHGRLFLSGAHLREQVVLDYLHGRTLRRLH